ncbi:ABC transporter permease [Candidatus Halocynthiibacter alkanivorans]|uniref:ABC transporter permease n=1 Tax=Candidatus Halocynthiibacter alkanivorans TaxID=2267619 RepID=UPI000DF4BFE3|nr:ABC transporter permease [Candidatus Halocynthiibacter alkanivorans]
MSLAAPLTPRRNFAFARTPGALILREMATSYGRSHGGYLWAVLEPVAAVALLSTLFSLVLRSPALGTNFAFFYATGFLPFAAYMAVSQQVASALRFSRPLLEYPAVCVLDALCARFLLAALTQSIVAATVLLGIILIYELNPVLHWAAVAQSFVLALALGLAVGVLNCFLMTRFPVWERVWAVANRPLFLVSAILYLPEALPGAYRGYIMINPLSHITSLMRQGFYPGYDAVLVRPGYVLGLALVLFLLGLIGLNSRRKEIIFQ